MSRPTIIHVITKLENGGAQRHALHILKHLPKDRYRTILAYGPGGYLDAQAQELEDVELELAWKNIENELNSLGEQAK